MFTSPLALAKQGNPSPNPARHIASKLRCFTFYYLIWKDLGVVPKSLGL